MKKRVKPKELSDYSNQVIYNYLKILENYGYLTEQPGGHIYYSRFIILDPDSVYEMRYVPTTMPEYKKTEHLMKNSEWGICKELIIELLQKYSHREYSEYFDVLEYLYNRIIVRSKNKL